VGHPFDGRHRREDGIPQGLAALGGDPGATTSIESADAVDP